MTAATTAPRTRSNPDEKRLEILDEAIRIIGDCGYNGFSIRQLATRCKLTNPGLLHYFGSKENLLSAVLQDRDRRDTEALGALFKHLQEENSGALQGIGPVRSAFLEIVKRNASQPELVRLSVLLGAESLVLGHPAGEYFEAKEQFIIAAFSAALDSVVPDPEVKVRQLLGALYVLEIQWLSCEQGFDLVVEWERIMDQLLPAVEQVNK